MKAATLGELTRAGLAVPEGIVLTGGAARAALAGLGEGATEAQVLGVPLPGEVEAALAEIAAHFGDATLAVRSSAAAEDLPDASYAGQYDSVLGVGGPDALRAAVRRCWASAYGERVRAYRPGGDRSPTIAVFVQRQVDADVAGVAFSANPVSGRGTRCWSPRCPGSPTRWSAAPSNPTNGWCAAPTPPPSASSTVR